MFSKKEAFQPNICNSSLSGPKVYLHWKGFGFKMRNPVNKIIAFIIVQSSFKSVACSSSCDNNSSHSRSLAVSVFSKKNDFGKWTDTFYARAEHSDSLRNISVDVLHNVTTCSSRRVIQIQGFIKDENYTITNQQIPAHKVRPMVFHSKHGSNVVVSNNGRTIRKKNIEHKLNGAAFTKRPLENDELFEVRLEQKGRRKPISFRPDPSFGIGILTKNPDDIGIPPEMFSSKYVWMYHSDSIFREGSINRSKYGPPLDPLPAGTRFGVMKKPSGDIHFFVNQVDLGPAISGICDPVYGVVDLWYNADKVTILSP